MRQLICATGNPGLFPELSIPKSTSRGWLRGSFKPSIGAESLSATEVQLHAENARLRQRVRVLQAVMSLMLVLVRVTACRLDVERLPDGSAKERLLSAIEKARQVIALASALKVIGLSASRYRAWHRRDKACGLTDRVSCPKKSPGQLTATEVESIRELATSSEYRHMPTSTLSRFAQPAHPVVQLLNGTKLYLHGVVDDFSRQLLARKLEKNLSPTTTCEVLAEAGK